MPSFFLVVACISRRLGLSRPYHSRHVLLHAAIDFLLYTSRLWPPQEEVIRMLPIQEGGIPAPSPALPPRSTSVCYFPRIRSCLLFNMRPLPLFMRFLDATVQVVFMLSLTPGGPFSHSPPMKGQVHASAGGVACGGVASCASLPAPVT